MSSWKGIEEIGGDDGTRTRDLRDLDALLDAAVATKIEGIEWDRAFEEWRGKYPEWVPDGDEPKE